MWSLVPSSRFRYVFYVFVFFILLLSSNTLLAATKNILLIGFWPPTNEMLRPFHPSAAHNHGSWIGKNWENSGYNVYAYFPEYPQGGLIGEGDFRVDFAATFNDFFRITTELKPIAIVGFGMGGGPWEIEANFPAYYVDFFRSGDIPSVIGVKPQHPIPPTLTLARTYHSTLPMEEIASRVNLNSNSGLNSWVDHNGAGNFLCGFLGYLSTWYQEEHHLPSDPAYTEMAGFIHVEGSVSQAKLALTETLRTVVNNLKNN